MTTIVIHTDPEVLAELRSIRANVEALQQQLAQVLKAKGDRLNRAELARFLGIHRHTLRRRLDTDRTLPRPGTDGKWLLSEVLEWQSRSHAR